MPQNGGYSYPISHWKIEWSKSVQHRVIKAALWVINITCIMLVLFIRIKQKTFWLAIKTFSNKIHFCNRQ